MKDTRIEVKVGFFVAAGLALLAVVVLSFSKGMTIFERHYKLTITFDSAAGLKPTADVMMAGVTIGQSTGLELTNNGRSVAVKVSILSKYQVRTNAIFHVDALGFLGDQFISVTPSTNLEAGFWQDGGQVQGQSPFNMQEAVRSVSGLLDQLKTTVIAIHQSVSNLNKTVLSDQSLSNASLAVVNAEATMATARQMAQGAKDLITSNTPAMTTAVSNLLTFSEKLNRVTADLDGLIATNRPAVNETVQNLHDTSASIRQVAADLQAGKGLAGGLLKDQTMKTETMDLISNASAMSAAFTTFGSNLNQRGIWKMMWQPKHTERSEKSPAPAHGTAGANGLP
jgi:phospholipid/cholesterol/gamma-HCH transport system substrate-binding protein